MSWVQVMQQGRVRAAPRGLGAGSWRKNCAHRGQAQSRDRMIECLIALGWPVSQGCVRSSSTEMLITRSDSTRQQNPPGSCLLLPANSRCHCLQALARSQRYPWQLKLAPVAAASWGRQSKCHVERPHVFLLLAAITAVPLRPPCAATGVAAPPAQTKLDDACGCCSTCRCSGRKHNHTYTDWHTTVALSRCPQANGCVCTPAHAPATILRDSAGPLTILSLRCPSFPGS